MPNQQRESVIAVEAGEQDTPMAPGSKGTRIKTHNCQKEALPRFPGDGLAMAGDRRAARGVRRLV